MADYDSLIEEAATEHGIPVPLAHALFRQESGYNPNAVNKETGASGLGQLMPNGGGAGVGDLHDPSQNIHASMRYLKEGLTREGNVRDALKYYYGGPNKKNWGPRTEAYPDQVLRHVDDKTRAKLDPPKEEFSPFKPQAEFKPFTPQTDKFKPFKPTIEPQDKGPGVGDFLDYLGQRAGGTVMQAGDMATSLATMVPSWGEGIQSLAEGKSPEDARKEAEAFQKDYSFSESRKKLGQPELPTNPAIDATLGTAAKIIHGLVNSDSNVGLGDGVGSENVKSAGPIINPMTGKILEDMTNFIGAKKGSDIIEGSARRVPDGPLELPAPAKSNTPTLDAIKQLEEQKQFENQRNNADVAQYNQNPKAYGVDESGAFQPFRPVNMTMIDPTPPLLTLDDGTQLPKPQAEATNTLGTNTPPRYVFPSNMDGYVADLVKRDPDGTKNMGSALDTVIRWTQDPFEQELARKLVSPVMDSSKFTIHNEPDTPYLGETTITPREQSANVQFVIDIAGKNMSGLSPGTILHEALHIKTFHALTIGNYYTKLLKDGKDKDAEYLKSQYPEAVQFAEDLYKLSRKVEQPLKERIDGTYLTHWKTTIARMQGGRNTFDSIFKTPSEIKTGNINHELLAWGLTDPYVRKIMKNIYIVDNSTSVGGVQVLDGAALKKKQFQLQNNPPTSLFDKMVDSVMSLVGMGHAKQVAIARAKFRGYMDFVDNKENKSAFQELEKIVYPMLKSKENAKGYDPDIVAQAFKDFVDSGKVQMAAIRQFPPKAQDVIQHMVSPYRSFKDAKGALGPQFYKYPDLTSITGNFYPVNMVPNIAKNVVVTFAFSQIREIAGASHALEKFLVLSIKKFTEADKKDKNAIVTTLNEINRPEIQEILRNAGVVQQNIAAGKDPYSLPDVILSHYGLDPQQIDLYRKTLEPLFKALLALDQRYIKLGFERDLNSEVIGYFPRSFGYGKFTVKGIDSTGALKYFRRAPTFGEIREIEEMLRSQGLQTIREHGKDFQDFKSHLIAMMEMDPHSPVAKVGAATLAAAEEHKRSQEFERSVNGVAGFIGQQLNNPKELELLISTIYHRIALSIESYKAANLLTKVLRPMQEDPLTMYHYPNATKWVADVIRRELGSDISEFKAIDHGLRFLLDATKKAYYRAFTNKVVDLKPGELVIDATSNKASARYVTAIASAWTLAGNIPNLVTNAATIPLESLMGGWPDSHLLKANPAKAVTAALSAHAESIKDLAALQLGIANKELTAFMQKAIDRGLILANAFADIPETKADIEKSKGQKIIDTALNVPRKWFNDPVEVATNYTAVLYYKRLVESLFPTMKNSEKFDLVISLAKRYTGDYARYNKALMWDKGGVVGQGASNFSIWLGTRLGQFHELVKTIGKGRITPMVSLIVAGILVAGVQGLPGAQDYENVRQRLASWSDHAINLPPLDLAMKQLSLPEWLRNGVLLNSTGYDLATRGKWSGFSDIGGVTYTLPAKIVDFIVYLDDVISENWPSEVGDNVSGTTIQHDANFVRSLPTAAQGPVRDRLMTREFRGDGKASYLSSHGGVPYTQDKNSAFEVRGNQLNFKTKQQAEDQRDFYNTLYSEKKYDKTIKELKQAGIEQLLKSVNARKKGEIVRAETLEKSAKANLIKLKKISPTGFDKFSAEVLQGFLKETDTTDERLLKGMIKSHDAGRIIMILNALRTIEKSPVSSQKP